MNNSYIIAVVIVVVVILGFVFGSRKTDAPVSETIQSIEGNLVLEDGSYTLDTESSTIGWKGEFIGGASEEGTIKLNSGNMLVEGGVIKSGEFTIDMHSIKNSEGKVMLEEHLKNDDFFSVNTFPTATFVIRSFAPSSATGETEGRYVIGGNLTIKDITLPISFITSVTKDQNSSTAALNALSSFAINRADWQIKYNSSSFFKNLGDKAIRDAVEIKLDLKAIKE